MGKQNIKIKKGLLALALTVFPGTFQNVANRLHEKHCFGLARLGGSPFLSSQLFVLHVNGSPSFVRKKLARSELPA